MNAKIREVEPFTTDPRAEISPAETARYTREMLESLRELALRQGHMVLAGLLEAAAREARRLIANSF